RTCCYQDHAPSGRALSPKNRVPSDFWPAPVYRVYEAMERPRSPRETDGGFALATLYTPEIAEMGELTSDVLWAYAKRHGYKAVIAATRIDKSRAPSWSKLLLVEHYLTDNPTCEWLMWVDADVVIVNPR